KIKKHLEKLGFSVEDLGTHSKDRCDYPGFAARVASGVSKGKYKRGVLVCKTGIGNSIVANRFPGVRAGLIYNVTAARLSRQHNDSNVLVLGSRFVNEKAARRILQVWLNTKFMGGRHKRRLDQIKKIEREIRCAKI
ncbi:MAG: ribose 5-phosphate isomerase B, partial [Deltaproteobacteria bacterium]